MVDSGDRIMCQCGSIRFLNACSSLFHSLIGDEHLSDCQDYYYCYFEQHVLKPHMSHLIRFGGFRVALVACCLCVELQMPILK